MWLACSHFLPCTLTGRERRFSETQARLLRRQFTALDRSELAQIGRKAMKLVAAPILVVSLVVPQAADSQYYSQPPWYLPPSIAPYPGPAPGIRLTLRACEGQYSGGCGDWPWTGGCG